MSASSRCSHSTHHSRTLTNIHLATALVVNLWRPDSFRRPRTIHTSQQVSYAVNRAKRAGNTTTGEVGDLAWGHSASSESGLEPLLVEPDATLRAP